LTFDYGLTTPELFLPHRREGTLRAYRRHRLCTDLLASPGEQDLTAHVDFSALQTAGESAGLRTAFFGTQSSFLTSIASPHLQSPQGLGWTPQQIRQFHTLTHPEHLGHKFRVLLQTRLPTVS
jgi:SAM-dependent MidA family methyltransferase